MSLYIDIEKTVGKSILKVKINQECKKLCLLGQSGSGKSMTLKCIAGLEKPDKGKIILNDKILFDSEKNINLSPQDRKVGFLFQNYALFPHMTVIENIEIGISNIKKSEKELLIKMYMSKLKLVGLNDRYPHELSGGQAQRVALARVLVTNPEILLLDEPFSALDYHLRKSIEFEITEILNDYNKDCIIVTHDIDEAYRMADDIVIYDNLESKSKRNKHELFNNPKTVLEAKITGCRNISQAKLLECGKLYIVDWDISIDINNDNDFRYIGIRENYIDIVEPINTTGNKFILEKIIENPESLSVVLKCEKTLKKLEINIYNKDIKFSIGDSVSIEFSIDKIYYLT